MNERDSRKLTDAIKDLTRQLRSGGSAPSSPSSEPAAPGQPPDPAEAAAEAAEKRRTKFEEDMRNARSQELEYYETKQRLAEIDSMTEDERLDKIRLILAAQADGVDLTTDEITQLSILRKSEEDRARLRVQYAKKDLDDARKQRKVEEELLDPVRERVRLLDDTEDAVKNVFSGIIKTSKLKPDPKRGVVGFLRSVTLDTEAREEALDTFHKQVSEFKSLLTPTNLLGMAMEGLGAAIGSAVTLGFGALIRVLQGVAELIVGAIVKFDALGASIAKTTGHGRGYAEQMINISNVNRDMTLTLDDMIPSFLALQNILEGVNGISRETLGTMTQFTAQANRLGVSFEETGQFMKDAMVGGGLSADEAMDAFSSLNEASKQMGVNFSQLSSQFLSNRGSFAVYGQSMQKVFLRTSSVARQMGLELGTVLGMSDKFKTFEDSAGFVAEFNHMVGASLDPLEMMRLRAQEGPDAVAKALKDSIGMAGKSFDELSFSMREGISDSLGVPMNELRNLMASDLDMSLADDLGETESPMEELINRGKESLTIFDRLQKMLVSVAEKFAVAFGFDKFAGKGVGDLLNSIETFIQNDMMNTMIPIIRDDIVPMLNTIANLFGSMEDLPFIGDLLKDKRYQGAAKDLSARAEDDSTFEGLTANEKKTAKRMMKTRSEQFGEMNTWGLGDDDEEFDGSMQGFAKQMMFITENMKRNKDEKDDVFELRKRSSFERLSGMSFQKGQELSSQRKTTTPRQDASSRGRGMGSHLNEIAETRAAKSNGGPEKKQFGSRGVLEDGLMYLHQGEQIIPSDFWGRGGAPMSASPIAQSGQETKVNVVINVDDRKLRDLFTTTVEKVIVGEVV